MRMLLSRTILTTVLAVPLLAASAEARAEVSDADLLRLLGTQSLLYDDNSPKKIPEGAVTCVRLIAGAEVPVLKDMTAEQLATTKTTCRQRLAGVLDDPQKNPAGLTLDDFEDIEFAERITALRDKVDADLRREREEARAAELENQLKLTTGAAAYLEKWLPGVAAPCAEWDDLQEQATRRDPKFRPGWLYNKPSFCDPDTVKRMRASLAERLVELEAGRLPLLPLSTDVNFKDLDDHLQGMRADIEAFREAIR